MQMTTHQVKVKKHSFKTTSSEVRRSFISNLLVDQTKNNYVKPKPIFNIRIFPRSITKFHTNKLKDIFHHDMHS